MNPSAQLLLEGLLGAFFARRLGHGLLLQAEDESSSASLEFLRALFTGLLCMDSRQGGRACGQCASCKIMAQNPGARAPELFEVQHPDAVFLKPENSKGYAVDQIRALIGSFHLTRSLSPARICWIESAELLSVSGGGAANALLKLLEEPRPHSFLILSTQHIENVLPTLRSRCQTFKLSGSAEIQPLDEGWRPLSDWISKGFPGSQVPALPPDRESFWEDRDEALRELETVYQRLWLESRGELGQLPRHASMQVLDLFAEFESLIKKIRGYAAPALQWNQFRSQLWPGR